MKLIFRILSLAALVIAVSCSSKNTFSENDLKIIHTNSDSLLHIYSVENPQELEVLRTPSVNLTKEVINSEDFRILKERMLKTASAAGAKGLAAPQVGINKAVVVIQRADKEGSPYEVYPNLFIKEVSKEMDISEETSLSIPEKKQYVDRYVVVVIQYYDIESRKVKLDTISTYESAMFQHYTDHLDGILFTDNSW